MLEAHLFEGEREFVIAQMKRVASYLEYGTGGSTLLAAVTGIRRIVSVDSDLACTEKLRAQLPANCDITLIHCDIGPTTEWGVPTNQSRVQNWPGYITKPWQAFLSHNVLPQLIYIDGRFRVACALYSLFNIYLNSHWFSPLPRVMVHDFSDRPHYHKILDYGNIVASANTLIVLTPKRRINVGALMTDLLSFQFDVR